MNNSIKLIAVAAGLALAAPAAFAADIVGEWSIKAGQCDEMRVIYTADGDNPTKVNAEGNWVEVSEPTSYEFDGEYLTVRTSTRQDIWQVVTLTDSRLEMVNQDPEAAEHGAAQASFERCGPR